MEVEDQIEKFRDFFESQYQKTIHAAVDKGEAALIIDFSLLSKFDPEISESLLDDPDDLLKAGEMALHNLEVENELKLRVKNLPKTQKYLIRNIRSAHLNRFLAIEGIVRQASDVRPQVTSAKFECPSCGNTLTMLQLDTKFKEPSRCSCGRKGKFKLLSKDLVDAQRIVLEESPESLGGGDQPKRIAVFLKEDLVDPHMEKRTTPGSKVRILGQVREVPIFLNTGVQSTRFDIVIDSNMVVPIEESFDEVKISKKDEKAIMRLKKDPHIFEKLIKSVAPSIQGHEKIKEALVLQLLGGVRKTRNDGTTTRGDLHLLLIGDPGCIVGDSQVALFNKGMEKIINLGDFHGQEIKEAVTKIKKNSKDKAYDYATVFQSYPLQRVLRVITETGKEVTGTYNQPFLTKSGWKRADKLEIGEKMRVMPKIPNNVKSLFPTGFSKLKTRSNNLKKITVPNKFTPELGGLCGYLLGDGNIHKNGYKVACYINNEEKDLIPEVKNLWRDTFRVIPKTYCNQGTKLKTIDDGSGMLRQFVSTQDLFVLEVNSKQINHSLSVLANKRVPQQIFRSPNQVVSKFISWLFEADGCVFGNGRGRTAIQLKSIHSNLLRDVQLLLLYFGIHSRINVDNLCIRRARDIELFAKYIGFNSIKKKERLQNTLDVVRKRSYNQIRKKPQRWEKVVSIVSGGIKDVYDFEVPKSQRFIANGIVCHNSAKSTLLTAISKIAPRARYVAGRSASAAGITVSVVRDEFTKGWALEAGAMVLANKGILCLDEMDKMTVEDTSALHEGMEQQTISVSKANIQATLRAETTVLAAANPKFGRFDPFQPIAAQIDLPPALINRFDLIFPVRDIPNREKDEKIARHVLKLHQKPMHLEPEINRNLIKKYVAYAKQAVNPYLTDAAILEIERFYVELRNSNTSSDDEIRPIPISARQLEALVRLSEGSARVRLSNKVSRADATRAIELLKHCLMQVGFDPETGQIDIDRIASGITASTRNKIGIIREIMTHLEESTGKKTIAIEDIINMAAEKGVDDDGCEQVLDKLKKEGQIFEPKTGWVAKI